MTMLSPEIQAELAKLHDIRLPEPIGWWPLAPGWWALLALGSITVLTVVVLEYRRRRTVRYAALRELDGLKARLSRAPAAPDVVTDLAVLLRRVVLSGPEARKFAAASGPVWVAELGQGPDGLSVPVAELLANAPYAPPGTPHAAQELRMALSEAETWIRRHS
ncbi:MAG: DUF4381 domain-containing protein [Albidovulum sp.]